MRRTEFHFITEMMLICDLRTQRRALLTSQHHHHHQDPHLHASAGRLSGTTHQQLPFSPLISRIIPVGLRTVWHLRHSPAGYVPIRLAHLGRGPGRGARRLRGDSRERGPVHSGLWRIVAERRRHRKCLYLLLLTQRRCRPATINKL